MHNRIHTRRRTLTHTRMHTIARTVRRAIVRTIARAARGRRSVVRGPRRGTALVGRLKLGLERALAGVGRGDGRDQQEQRDQREQREV